MKRFIGRNLSSLWLSVIAIAYGLALACANNYIRIVEPPLRYLLIALFFTLPIIKVIALYKGWDKFRGWVLIALAVTWGWVAVLYFIHPISNAGGILAISNVGHTFIHLARGRFEDNG